MNQITKKCAQCGGTQFYKSGACGACSRANAKRYRKNHTERCRARVNAYASKNREKLRAANATYKKENAQRLAEKRVQFYLENKESENARAANYRLKNKAKVNANSMKWQKENPEAKRKNDQNRRARKRQCNGSLSKNIVQKLLVLQKGLCPCCRQPLGEKYHIDHILPLALGGSNTDDNVQLLRANCNQRKSAKHPVDFMQSKGFLL